MKSIEYAISFAKTAHRGQKRRYTNEPYIEHPLAVMEIVSGAKFCTPSMLKAAVLHDVVEDTAVGIDDILSLFGENTATLVSMLTDVSVLSDGNREFRKAMDREKLSAASPEAKTIKLADMIHNMRSIIDHGKRDYVDMYMNEKRLLWHKMREGDNGLLSTTKNIIDSYFMIAEIEDRRLANESK